ncbi:MAG TPA: carboxypeptidase-like regulatory domain-containing protein [Blastocatellia bacterium]|nr:carboxypeptidase-like regulatory domain-containing protein [Blastocatellia bacterium]
MFRGARFSILFSTAFLSAFSVANSQTPQVDNRPRTASISGRVTIGGKAAANAKIVITEIKDRSGLGSQDISMVAPGLNAGEDYAVLTDAEGRYRLTNLPEGKYQAQAMLKGCVREKRSQNETLIESFSLNEGESREGVDFTLVRGGVITGRVTDADGRPSIASIISLQVVDEQGRRQDARSLQNMADMLMNFDMFLTDDRGVYRIYGLRAGRYLISSGGDSNRGISILTGAGGAYPRAWHPDAADENQAKIIEVEAGGEVTGVDIRLGAANRTYEASGRVVDDETGKPIAGSNLMCLKTKSSDDGAASSFDFGGFGGNTKTDEQGNFRLIGLAPGQYQLSLADYMAALTGGGGHYSDGVKFEIQGADVSGIEIRAKRGATISGVAVVEDADPSGKASLAQMMVIAQPQPPPPNEVNENTVMSAMSPVISRIGSDGGFVLKGVRPGKVALHAYGTSGGGLQLLRIERGGAEISDGIVVTGREDITGVRIILGKK